MARWFVFTAILAFAPYSVASAWSFAPTGVPFTISGEMSFSGSGMGVDCKVIYAGTTDQSGVGQITAASFSGGLLGACGGIHPLDLPWTVKPVDARGVVISKIAVRAPLIGDCFGRDVPVVIGKAGVIHFGHIDLSPKCAIGGGDLKTNPPVSIVP